MSVHESNENGSEFNDARGTQYQEIWTALNIICILYVLLKQFHRRGTVTQCSPNQQEFRNSPRFLCPSRQVAASL